MCNWGKPLRLFARIVISITSILLVGLVYCWSITQFVVSEEKLASSLNQAGVYSAGADVLKQSFVESLTAANVDKEAATAIVGSSVSSTSVATSAQPALRSFTAWLKSQDQAPLLLALDLAGIKSQIARQAKLSGSPEVSFVATREIPDELILVNKDSQQSVKGAQAGYSGAVELIPSLVLSVALGVGLLVLLALRQPSKRLSWPAWTMAIAGVVILALIYILPLVPEYTLPKTGQGQGDQLIVITTGLVKGLAQDTRAYAYILLGLGAVLSALSLVVKRRQNQKAKKKR